MKAIALVLAGLVLPPVATARPASDAATHDRVELDHVRVGEAARLADGETLRRYTFEPAAQPRLRLVPVAPWAGAGELRVRVQNAMPWAVTLRIDVEGTGGAHLQATVGLPAGPPQTLVVPLRATSPRVYGMQAGPPMPMELGGQRVALATTVDGAPSLRGVRAVQFSIPAPQAEQVLLIGTPGTRPADTVHDAYRGIVDRYGQYARGQWPEKIDSDAVLRAAHARERARLPGGANALGGHPDVQATTTGWFHTRKRDGRWQLVAPDGHPFFSLGVNAVVADGGRSYVQGREWMFTGLPPATGAWQAFYGEGDSRRETGAADRKNVV